MHTIQRSDAVLTARTVQRQLAALLPECRPAGTGDSTLEIAGQGMDAPRLISATMLEGGPLCRRLVPGAPTPGFRAFLDGTQRSEVVSYVAGVPLVLGHTAAVIRERRAGRMYTWGAPLSASRVYGPRMMLARAAWATLAAAYGDALVDTSDGDADVTSHPLALRDAAIHRVQGHREALEWRLAEAWCQREDDPLFIDGGISGSEAVAVSPATIGVVKSHRTLYAEGDALVEVLSLAHRERSSVFRVTSPKRTTVASWYLRLRDPEGHDPMWGLIRVESAHPSADAVDRIGERADEVSRWILAESSPLALPDARWDKMVYGIRDCEEFLRATR
ncbi:MAG: hypothetical protein LH467_06050 [Gemmatimonadaceae bacterium]|nr:hypothetical protein [Gemmatimonadaceae bacterium]